MSNPDIRKQSKVLIYHVYKYFKELVESKPNTTIKELFQQTQKATSDACGVSRSTVQKICAEADRTLVVDLEGQSIPSFESPKKSSPHTKPITDLDDFDMNIVRRTVQDFYDRGEYPTLQKLKPLLDESIGFSGCIVSLGKILKKLGFKYRKSDDGRKFLMERNDIVALRMIFLRKMYTIRREVDSRPVIYLDETWVNQNHTKTYTWQSSTGQGGLKVPIGKGSRLIICHAGSANEGFIDSAQLIFQSKSTGDYHQEMNAEVFEEWFIDLARQLEKPSVIVMDNASYHSTSAEKIPTTKTRKADILAWLQSKRILHDPKTTRPELLEIVRQHKHKYKMYKLDKIAYEMGHEVVRIPPYHCQYNPIELVWAQVKNEVSEKNKTFKIRDVRKLTEDAISHVSVDNWRKCCEHAEKLQEDDFVKEGLRDEKMQSLIINLQDDSDSSSNESDEL